MAEERNTRNSEIPPHEIQELLDAAFMELKNGNEAGALTIIQKLPLPQEFAAFFAPQKGLELDSVKSRGFNRAGAIGNLNLISLDSVEIDLCRQVIYFANAYRLYKNAALVDKGIQEPVNLTCRRISELLTTSGESTNFHLVIAAERIMCIADLTFFMSTLKSKPDSMERHILKSLKEGLECLDEIHSKLVFRAEDSTQYHLYSSYTRPKGEHDREGLPKDGIRRLLLSHKKWLEIMCQGRARAGADEYMAIKIRLRNIQNSVTLYKTMQREALLVNDHKAKAVSATT